MYKKFKKVLSNAPDEKSFVTENKKIKNLKELRTELVSNGKKFFNNYTENENHFANWIENVFSDSHLAAQLRGTKSFNETIKHIDDRIKYAELWLKHNEDMEVLHNYLVSDDRRKEFSPSCHNFEKLTNMDIGPAKSFIKNHFEAENRFTNKFEFNSDMLLNKKSPIPEPFTDNRPKKLSFFSRFNFRK